MSTPKLFLFFFKQKREIEIEASHSVTPQKQLLLAFFSSSAEEVFFFFISSILYSSFSLLFSSLLETRLQTIDNQRVTKTHFACF